MPWEQVAACDFVTERDIFGEVARRFLVCKDSRGQKLVTARFRREFDQDVAHEVCCALTGQSKTDWSELD